jgi:hypothetical protein
VLPLPSIVGPYCHLWTTKCLSVFQQAVSACAVVLMNSSGRVHHSWFFLAPGNWATLCHDGQPDRPVCAQYDEAERRREMAKNSLEKYTHYYERWATNESVRGHSIENWETEILEVLFDCQLVLTILLEPKYYKSSSVQSPGQQVHFLV